MIFDYWEQMQKPKHPSLSNGFVNPNEIKDQNVYVFISHGHGDHFDNKILEWKKVILNITYVFGWQAQETQTHHAFGKDRLSKSIGPLRVTSVRSNWGLLQPPVR